MDEFITMSSKEVKKYDIIKKVLCKELNGTEASKLLHLTPRQIRRLKKKVKEKGIKGLAHGNRGKRSNRSIPETERQKIIRLVSKHYHDFGPLLAKEKLEERHNIVRDKGTIRSIMIAEDIWKPKQKKKDKHRSWRQRRASYGELVQYDGSYEYWFEDRGSKCCLLAAIDDANSRVWARFDQHEGVYPTFAFWQGYIRRYGKPFSIYVDRFSTYSMNHKLAKENPDTLTQFERAMKEGLNIEVVHAGSAEAKGRVENLFKTLQDRLIKELRLNNISTIETANKFLEEEYLPGFNAKFMVEARSKVDLHKKLSKKEQDSLGNIFSKQYIKTVRNDFTVSHKTRWYQLNKEQAVTVFKGDKVTVEERMDNSIHLRLRGKYLSFKELPERPKKLNSARKDINWAIPKNRAYQPAKDHPWKLQGQAQYIKNFSNMSK